MNASGETVLAWAEQSRTRDGIWVVRGTASGRFTRATLLGSGGQPTVAIGRDGTAVVAWSAADGSGLRFSRARSGRAFSSPATLVRSTGAADGHAAAQPDGSTIVVYGGAHGTIRAVGLPRSGRPNAPTTLFPAVTAGIGPGQASIIRGGFRATPDGAIAVCCLDAGRTGILSHRPSDGWRATVVTRIPGQQVETVAPGRGDVAAGLLDYARGNAELGLFGTPLLTRVTGAGALSGPLTGPVADPRLAFGPVAAIDGSGRNVLVYQERKTRVPFSRAAPIYAVTGPSGQAFGARQSLDGPGAQPPAVRAYRDGAIAAWVHHGWTVAVDRAGTFRPAAAPPGPGPGDFDWSRSCDLATAGRHAALTWVATDGTLRASVGTP